MIADRTLEQAVEALVEVAPAPAGAETVPLAQAAGRVVAQDIFAPMDQPPFPRSPLDGYAVRHEDLAGATGQTPAVLRVTGRVFAGDFPRGPVAPGEAARIMTGAPIPEGATCVVRQEDTDGDGETVRVFVSHTKHENYCFAGEDMRRGTLLVSRGSRLDSACIGALSAQGLTGAEVFAQPRVGILSTGSELVRPGGPLPLGKIYDSNRATLAARARCMGSAVTEGGSTADDPDALAAAVDELLRRCGLVITTGGVSVGEADHMPLVGEKLGARLLFHGVALKPGGPAMALVKDGAVLLCLSGNPFAAAATFELLAAPVIRAMAGRGDVQAVRVRGVLRSAFPKANRGRRFLRGRMAGGDIYLPGDHASGVLSSMAGCNCLVDVPADTPPLMEGDAVEAVLMDGGVL